MRATTIEGALRKFHKIDVQNTLDQIASDRRSKRLLAIYMWRMRNNNQEIRIAGSSCRPQIEKWKNPFIR